jgi:hypothetical protein
MALRTCCPMLSPKELNFCKDVAADILRSSDNFSEFRRGSTISTVGNLNSSEVGTVHAYSSD